MISLIYIKSPIKVEIETITTALLNSHMIIYVCTARQGYYRSEEVREVRLGRKQGLEVMIVWGWTAAKMNTKDTYKSSTLNNISYDYAKEYIFIESIN